MKELFLPLLLLCTISVSAQQSPTDLDKSPLDISYWPANYPILKMTGKIAESPVARVIYSRPQKAGRDIFGGIVGYGQVWRLGANEATEIEFFKAVKLNGKTLAKGRYTLYAICNADKWTIIVNSDIDVWGLAYNQKKDVVRADFPVQKSEAPVEALTMYFDNDKNTANLNILWDTTKVVVPFTD
jgi:hypothetical protein